MICFSPSQAQATDDTATPANVVEVPEDQLLWSTNGGTVLSGISQSFADTLDDDQLIKVVVPEKATEIASQFGYYPGGRKNGYNSEGRLVAGATADLSKIAIVDFSNASNLTTIGTSAFYNCAQLADIPGFSNLNLTAIANQTFGRCTKLRQVIDLSEMPISSIGGNAFNGSGITGVILPDNLATLGVTNSNMPVFSGCSNLEYIRTASTKNDDSVLLDLPDGLTTLGRSALAIPASPLLTAINEQGLSIVIPESLTTISRTAFQVGGSDGNVNFVLPSDGWQGVTVDQSAFGQTNRGQYVVIFPDYNTYLADNTQLYNVSKSYAVTLNFQGTQESQQKLNNASVRYVYDDTRGWYMDENYTLPVAPEGTEELGDGYYGAWMLGGEELTLSSNVSGVPNNNALTATYRNDFIEAPTRIRFAVNGVAQSDDDAANKSNVFDVPASDNTPGSLGVVVEHPLLKEAGDDASPYVYFQYLWSDTQNGDAGGGARRDEQGFYDIGNYIEGNYGTPLPDPTDVNPISITPEDERVYVPGMNPIANGQNHYRVKIFGYYVNGDNEPEVFYKSSVAAITFSGPGDPFGTTTSNTYEAQVRVTSPLQAIEPIEKSGSAVVAAQDGLTSGSDYTADNLAEWFQYEDGSPLTETDTFEAIIANAGADTPSGNGEVSIENGTLTYRPAESDVGKTVELIVTASNAAGTTTATVTVNISVTQAANQPILSQVMVENSYADNSGEGEYVEGALVTINAGTRPGHTFAGWTTNNENIELDDASSATTTFTMPAEDVTVTANWTQNSSGGGGTIIPPGPTPDPGPTPTPDPEPDTPGIADPDDTGVSNWLNTEEHISYLNGYPDGTFGPSRNMTRAEVAAMFSNLLIDQDVDITTTFSDVAADAWYAEAVNKLASLGMIAGYEDGTFRPDQTITRAEFTAIAMRFTNGATGGNNIFSDVEEGAWYYDTIVGSIQYGWIAGYEDGTFRPNNTITRAEVTAITNRMLGRTVDADYIDTNADDLRQFPDVSSGHWAYYSIMEATNAHDYTKTDGDESWTAHNA